MLESFTMRDGLMIGGILGVAYLVNKAIPEVEGAKLNPISPDNYAYTSLNTAIFDDENGDGDPDQTLGTWTYDQCHRPGTEGLPRPLLCSVLDWLAK